MKKTVISWGMFARSTLIAIRVVAAISISAPAMAMHGGGGGAGGIGSVHGGGTGPAIMNHAGGGAGRTVTTPMIGGRIHGWSGNAPSRATPAWGRGHDHRHG